MPLSYIKEDSPWPRRVKENAIGWLALVTLVPLLLGANVVQTMSALISPLAPNGVRRLNRWLANWWWGLCARFTRHIGRAEVRVSGHDVPENENAILLCNHQSMSDITVLFELGLRKGRLGDLKWYVKDVLKWVPGIGWGMLFLDCLFVKRNWTQDKASIAATFKRIVDNKVPVWVVSFAEGTRITPEKSASSREFAASRGYPQLQHVLLPRTKGVVATVEGMGDHLDAIYDLTIGYTRAIPTLWQWTKGLAPVVHLHVRRWPIEEVPKEAEALASWLVQRYADKDQLLAGFYESGEFASSESS